jgi:TonB family protein
VARRYQPAHSVAVAFVAAGLVHVAVLGTVDAVDLLAGGIANQKADPAPEAAAVARQEIESTCTGDAALASAAHVAACMPGTTDLQACFDAARAMFDLEVARCRSLDDAVQVSLAPAMTAEQIARIDPEPLLELLDQVQQQKFEQQQKQQIAQLEQQVQQQRQQKPLDTQVVETAKPTTEMTPDQARFVAEYDTKVKKETVARGARNEPMIAKSRPEQLTPKENAREPSIAEPMTERPEGRDEKAPDQPGKLSMRTPGALSPSQAAQEAKQRGAYDGSTAPTGDGTTARKGQGAIDRDRRDVSETAGGGGAGGGAPPMPNLKPSKEVLERAIGGGSVDHLEAIEDGDETSLNARRWVFASFFNRMKRQVAQQWEPGDVWRRHDPKGTVYGFKTRVTQLKVSLDARGKLSKVSITRPSGVDVLDDEAVRAFTAAAPFPNPPAGLVQDDRLITFEFSFHFEIGAPRTSWRILRSM